MFSGTSEPTQWGVKWMVKLQVSFGKIEWQALTLNGHDEQQ